MVELKPTKANWSQLINSAQTMAENNAVKNTDPVVILEKAAMIATAMLERQITAHDMSLMSMALALAKVSEGIGNQDNYREVIVTAACSGQLVGSLAKGLADLRVMSDMANQLVANSST